MRLFLAANAWLSGVLLFEIIGLEAILFNILCISRFRYVGQVL